MTKILTSMLVGTCIVLPGFAAAHAGGASFETESGAYTIDIGYEPETFETARYVRFDFDLLREDAPAAYDDVWVRVLREDRTEFATGIRRQPVGPTTMLYTFHEAGVYTLEASYRAGGQEIATGSFTVEVAQSEGDRDSYALSVATALMGALFGALVVTVLRRRA